MRNQNPRIGEAAARYEKPMLFVATSLPVILAMAGGIYEWNNRVPNLQIPPQTLPDPNAFELYQQAGDLFVWPQGQAIDRHLDSSVRSYQPTVYSKAYDRCYPASRKLMYLSRQQRMLQLIRRALTMEYCHPRERPGGPGIDFTKIRNAARLLQVEIHLRGQLNDWDGAAQSAMDIMRMGYQVQRGGPMVAAGAGRSLQKMSREEFYRLLPHLSATRARQSARQLEALQQTAWPIADNMTEEKHTVLQGLLHLIRQRDLRPIYMVYACFDCKIPEAQWRSDMEKLPPLLQSRLAWMNKSRIVNDYSQSMDRQIAAARDTYVYHPATNQNHPDDHLQQVIQVRFDGSVLQNRINCAQNAMLTTLLALRAYRVEHGAYPDALDNLVPRYLSRVPLDPFTGGQPLRYARTPLRYYAGSRFIPRKPPVTRLVPSGGPGGPGAPGAGKTIEIQRELSFRLYSVGLNASDDGGQPYLSESNATGAYYRISLWPPHDRKVDLVAGIN